MSFGIKNSSRSAAMAWAQRLKAQAAVWRISAGILYGRIGK
jgi:hypothetical protein